MITYVEDNRTISELEAKSKYPNCRFILVKAFEKDQIMYGELKAVSSDISEQNKFFQYGHSFDNLGLVFFGGDYNIDTICQGTIRFGRNHE